jgi:hypothetical protein
MATPERGRKMEKKEGLDIRTERSVYRSPTLLYYGKIHQLTATGSGINVENKGLDANNNMKRKP